jgi:hypothetical protein
MNLRGQRRAYSECKGQGRERCGNVIGVVSSKLDAIRVADITGDIPQNINFAISEYARPF